MVKLSGPLSSTAPPLECATVSRKLQEAKIGSLASLMATVPPENASMSCENRPSTETRDSTPEVTHKKPPVPARPPDSGTLARDTSDSSNAIEPPTPMAAVPETGSKLSAHEAIDIFLGRAVQPAKELLATSKTPPTSE